MEHERYLLDLLRPLRVYDLSASAVNRGELGVYGKGLDAGYDALSIIVREMSLTTAENAGLDRVEELLPYHPVGDLVEDRRQALAALVRIGGDSFTLDAINDTLFGCGINARAAESGQPGYVQISFPDVAGIPASFEELRTIIEEILPCHLEVTYLFWYTTWGDQQLRLSTWGDGEALGLTWYELSIWQG